jgi:hypothetical protein
MTIEEFKKAVEGHRQKIKGNTGLVTWSENGPVGMVLIDAVVRVLEDQEQRLAALEGKTARKSAEAPNFKVRSIGPEPQSLDRSA